ncbi:MAG: hypothetical protein OEV48_06490 [Acidobacteriota bacterium]|jgi:hypothetical protein|nr:hypothetical protein [Acidobacteriota bacterium]
MPDESAPNQTTRSPREERLRSIVGFALIAGLSLVTLYGIYRPLGPPGIDPGWQWAVNQAADAGLVFGRDIVFTYGPLAFLMVPLDVSSNLLVANLFLLVVQVLFTAALAALFVRDRHVSAIAAFAALFVVVRHQELAPEGFLILVVGLLALLGVFADRRFPIAAAATLAAILMLVKMSLGIASLAILAVACIVARFLFNRPYRLALGLIPFPVTLIVFATVLFDRPGTFFHWLQLSLQMVSGYSIANSITNAETGPALQVVVGAIAVGAWIGFSVLLCRNQRLLACNLVFVPVVMIQFRLAFVRHDNHQYQFIPFMLALIAVSSLFAQRRRQITAHIAFFALLLIGGALANLVDPVGRGLVPANLLSGGSGSRALSRLLHIRETRAMLAAESVVNLEPLRFGDDLRELLEGSHNGVGTLPWEIQHCPANGLEWNPTPTLQLYSAYTRDLDLWSAEHYASADAPQFIINSFSAVGMRRQLFDAPATWRTVFLNYEMRSVGWKPEPALLLERRPEPLQWSFEEVSQGTIAPGGASIPVPATNHLLFADINLRLNGLGRIRKSVFRVPAVILVMAHESGHVSVCRLIPGTSGNSLLINRFPRDFRGYRRLWQGIQDDPVERVAISGDGTSSFRPSTAVTWRELRIASPTPPSVEDPPQDPRSEPSPRSPVSP